jgi:hypothetical protein
MTAMSRMMSSASMSAAPSPMSSCWTRPRARLRSPRSPRRGPTSRAASSTASRPGAGPRRVAVVVHGTTAGTNALLERKGARIGVITTEGLRDVLEMRRRDRPRTWGLRGDFEPVVPRDLRLEVPERTLADGTIHTPVDLDAVRAAARDAARRKGARRSRSSSPTPMPTPRTRPAAVRGGARGLAQRPCELRLVRDPARDPGVRAVLDRPR